MNHILTKEEYKNVALKTAENINWAGYYQEKLNEEIENDNSLPVGFNLMFGIEIYIGNDKVLNEQYQEYLLSFEELEDKFFEAYTNNSYFSEKELKEIYKSNPNIFKNLLNKYKYFSGSNEDELISLIFHNSKELEHNSDDEIVFIDSQLLTIKEFNTTKFEDWDY